MNINLRSIATAAVVVMAIQIVAGLLWIVASLVALYHEDAERRSR
jgi:hypothetical protein